MDVGMWWIGTGVLVAVLLTMDLVIGGRRSTAPSTREAGLWVAGYCVAAIAFGGLLLAVFGPEYAGQFLAGWVTEYSLSVDNLFVFMVLMSRFAVPPELQLRVLTIGIVLALVLRGLLIAVGAAVVTRYAWVFLIFGAFLLWTAWGLLRSGEHGEPGPAAAGGSGDEKGEPNRLVRLLERFFPTTREWHGTRWVVRLDGRRTLTPMIVTMIAIGTTDVLFALDSIPAIFGLTREPFLVVSANAFALMGLRQLYFLVGNLIERLPLLSIGLSAVLAFIGVKLILEALHENTLPFINGGRPLEGVPHISVTVSLAVVVGTLTLAAVVGLLLGRRIEPRIEPVTKPRIEPVTKRLRGVDIGVSEEG